MDHAQAHRLDRFFGDWRAARAQEPLGLLAERLGRFFVSFKTSSSPEDLAARGSALDTERLQAVFDALHAPLAEAKAAGAFFNAWAVAGLKRDEVRNAAVLASLLDPQLCPVTGPAFLRHLLEATGGDVERLPARVDLMAGYTVRTEDCPLGGGENRVDVTIEGREFLLFIEVKIDAGEGALQLDRYDGVLQNKAGLLGKWPILIYLSPRPPVSLPAEAIHITWLDIAAAARKAGKPSRGRPRSVAEALLTQFSIHASAFSGKTHVSARPRPAPDQQSGRP